MYLNIKYIKNCLLLDNEIRVKIESFLSNVQRQYKIDI